MEPMVRRRRQRPQEVKDSTMALCLLHIGKLDLAEPFVTLSQLTITLKENEVQLKSNSYQMYYYRDGLISGPQVG